MKKLIVVIFFLIFILNLSAYQADVSFTDSWDQQGLSIKEQNSRNLKLNYSITNFRFEEILIDSENLTNIHLPEVFLPNDEGMPNLPGSGSYIAVPHGAKSKLNIVNYRIEKYSNIEIAPAPRIPLDTEDGPLEYNKNNETYSRNANYPENFIQLSEVTKLRGVDVVMLGVTPFQYNPVTKELLVYRDVEMEITFSGGTGHFGEDRLRSRWWDPIIKDAILNSSVLPEIDYNSRDITRDGAEYLIICPDDTDFITWANTIKDFRQQQGISTMIQTVTQVGGNTVSAIQTYVDNAYNNWSTPPSAVLFLGDYGTGTSGIISEWYTHPAGYSDFVSDNYFADVDGDDLPDVVFARITANDAAQLEVMITKFIDYENNPPTDPDFYNHPITALGWQTERWFQICSEVVGGYFREALGKDPVRINAIYSGTPGSVWSTAPNTADVVNYFGPSGLGYIPATPAELGGWSGGTATDVVNAINAGSFLLQHRDHGSYSGWGEPSFTSTNISSLTNVDNKLPYIFSINCQTGAFHNASECFTEKFHRHTYSGQNSGALGLLAATEVSYSFVNDAFVWGVMDNMFPDFMPAETTDFPNNFVMPAFGNAAGKHFLYRTGWPYNYGDKLITYRLFHHHGDAFLNVYSEVPTDLTISHSGTLISGATTFSVTADAGSFIALTVNNEIIGTADGTGSPVDITIPAQSLGTMLVTVTKQNNFRYSQDVNIIVASGPYVIVENYIVSAGGDDIIEYGETVYLTITLKNEGVAPATNVNMTLTETDAYITLTDAAESFGTIAAGASVSRTTAYTFTVSNSVPDDHAFVLNGSITSVEDTWNPNISLAAFAPVLSIQGVAVLDGDNGRLDPDETTDIVVTVENSGGATTNNINAILSTLESYITVNDGSDTIGSIAASSIGDVTFNITTNSSIPIGHSAEFDVDMTADLGYSASDNFFLTIGLILEDFETGDFTSFNWPWTFSGEADWAVVDVEPYEGIYCAKSGVITHYETSELILISDVTVDGTMSFFRKVSSESSYDYFKFYINGTQQGSWSGEVAWEEVSYSVTAGSDVEFKWQYSKDSSVDTGSDCAWVDYIIFPALGSPQPAFSLSPTSIDFGIVETGTSSINQFIISNTGGATLNGNITTPAGYTIAAADYILAGSKHLKNDNNSDNTISYSISGTSSQTFDLVFSPLLATTYTGNVVIISDDPDHLSTDLPVTGSGGTAAVISVTPAVLNFGDTTFGSNSTLQFTIENTGDADLTGSITTPTDFSVGEFSEINSRITLTDNVINFIIAGGNSVIYNLTFLPTTLGSYSDNVTIDHNSTGGTTLLPISGNCVSTIAYPYLVDFENAGSLPNEWTNAADDDFDWSLLTGATGSSSTGPSGDHTTGSGYYIYTESSSPNFPTLRADLLTPIFDLDELTTPYLSYWYHMYGSAMGSLHIDLSDGITWQEDIIPSVSGNQDDQWLEQIIDLSTYSGTVQLRFRGITGSSYTSDMAIDDFWMGDYDPPENIQIQIIGNNVHLSWDTVAGTVSYKIYYSTLPDSGFTELGSSATNSFEHVDGAIDSRLFYYITAE